MDTLHMVIYRRNSKKFPLETVFTVDWNMFFWRHTDMAGIKNIAKHTDKHPQIPQSINV